MVEAVVKVPLRAAVVLLTVAKVLSTAAEIPQIPVMPVEMPLTAVERLRPERLGTKYRILQELIIF